MVFGKLWENEEKSTRSWKLGLSPDFHRKTCTFHWTVNFAFRLHYRSILQLSCKQWQNRALSWEEIIKEHPESFDSTTSGVIGVKLTFLGWILLTDREGGTSPFYAPSSRPIYLYEKIVMPLSKQRNAWQIVVSYSFLPQEKLCS